MNKIIAAVLATALGAAVPARAQTVFGGAARAGSAGGASAAAWRLALPGMTTSLGLGASPSPALIGSLSALLARTPLTPAGFDVAPSVQIKAQVEGALVARTLPILEAGADAAAKAEPGSARFNRAFEDVLDLRAVAHMLPDQQFVLISRQGAEIEKLLVARHEGKSADAIAKAEAIAAELSGRAPLASDDGLFAGQPADPRKRSFLSRFALKPSKKAVQAPLKLPARPADWNEKQARAFLAATIAPFESRLAAAGYTAMPMLTWDDKDIDARVRFDGLFHNVILSRGFLKMPGLTKDALALAVVHEIGHMLGAGPKDDWMRLAVEGEADYFSGTEAAAALLSLGDEDSGLRRGTEYAEAVDWLKARGFHGEDLRLKARALSAALRLRRVAEGGRHDLNLPDPEVVEMTLRHYPSGQSRLDTMAAGIAGLPRPRSWAHPKDFPAGS